MLHYSTSCASTGFLMGTGIFFTKPTHISQYVLSGVSSTYSTRNKIVVSTLNGACTRAIVYIEVDWLCLSCHLYMASLPPISTRSIRTYTIKRVVKFSVRAIARQVSFTLQAIAMLISFGALIVHLSLVPCSDSNFALISL